MQRVVYTSFLGAAPDAPFTLARDHWVTEQKVLSLGLRHVFLRDSLYADFLPLMRGEDGAIRGPAGDGRFAAVAIDDVAEIASRAKATTRDAQAIADQIRRGRGTVGAMVMDEQLYDDLQELARDLKHNPWKFLWKE